MLPAVSKTFERLMHFQLMQFADSFLSILLCGFRRGFSTQNALSRFLEKVKMGLDNKKFASAILMGLSKAFDCLNHELLIAKLDGYGLGRSALEFIYSYLSARKQRVQVNGFFSNWLETNLCVPQGSILGPHLFNIHINDMLYLMDDAEICNCAEDTTIYVLSDKTDDVVQRLEDGVAAILTLSHLGGGFHPPRTFSFIRFSMFVECL